MLTNRLAISSISLGQHASHKLPDKISAAAECGFQGIEITYPDLNHYADSLSSTMLETARIVRLKCEDHNLEVIAFAAFENFEGQKSPITERLEKAQEWLAIAHALGAAHLQVPSNYDRSASSDRKVIVSEFQQLSDLANAFSPPMKIAYENLAWGMHCDLWQHALQIVQDVARDNFGLCLDSFHICVKLWADPFARDGRQPNGDRHLRDSLRLLACELPLDKLFYLQLSDGELLDPPYSETHPWYDAALEPGHVWSNEARPFPLEEEYGGYMPVQEVAQAFLVELGFTGWVSMETFDRRMRSEDQGPSQSARRGARSWETLSQRMTAAKPVSGKL